MERPGARTSETLPTSRVEEAAPGVYRYLVDLGERPLAGYVIPGRRTLVVDTGIDTTPADAMLPLLACLGVDPRSALYLISHADADHFGGNASLRALVPDATILAPELDRLLVESGEWLIERRYRQFEASHGLGYDAVTIEALRAMMGSPEPVDIGLTGGEAIVIDEGIEALVLHTPGHTAGHLTVWLSGPRVAIIQDAILDAGVTNYDGEPIQPPPYLDLDWYRGSIETVRALAPAWLLTAHFPVAGEDDAMAFLERSLGWTGRFDVALDEAISEVGPRFTARDLLAPLDARLGPYPIRQDFVFAIVAHLRVRERDGSVATTTEEGTTTWTVVR